MFTRTGKEIRRINLSFICLSGLIKKHYFYIMQFTFFSLLLHKLIKYVNGQKLIMKEDYNFP